jgi:dTDP-glucose pyrophosphorylase
MTDFKRTLFQPDKSILDALAQLDRGSLQILLVVDENQKLVGVITDGDIRRAILHRIPIDAPASRIMNPKPVSAPISMPREALISLMQARVIRHMPRVDDQGRVVGLDTLEALLAPRAVDNLVVLMAGGLGTRLRPLTDDVPKPMLQVGGRPLLEIIVTSLMGQGFRRFRLAVNYRAQAIISHFGNGERFGCEVDYLKEEQPLGTAGCLSLLPRESVDRPFIVMNGDLLTALDFRRFLQFHVDGGHAGTVAVRHYEQQVPYGVVETADDRIVRIVEKPIRKVLVNSGIYALDPSALDRLSAGRVLGMPDLLLDLTKHGSVAAYPMHEYWIDIGRHEDLQRAEAEFGTHFG